MQSFISTWIGLLDSCIGTDRTASGLVPEEGPAYVLTRLLCKYKSSFTKTESENYKGFPAHYRAMLSKRYSIWRLCGEADYRRKPKVEAWRAGIP